ncbi:hypothetical protein MCOR23_001327 [Pyricularia oryzae]|nr:hypothetical protein MCOR23_001327 [Pyricularia oryzae]
MSQQPVITLSDHLEKQNGATFKKLYQQPATAFAIFRRMLPPLAKTFVMSLLYMPQPLPLTALDSWVKPEAKKNKDQALSILRSMHITTITPVTKEKPVQEMSLTPNFKKSLRLALEGGGSHNSFGVPSSLPIPPQVDVAFLDKWARSRWDAILHYVVNSVEETGSMEPSKKYNFGGSKLQDTVKTLLVQGGLVQRRSSERISITKTGFTFLLQEANAQVWTLLLQWLHSVNEDNTNRAVDMLSFLFMLGTLELGQAYDTGALSEERRNMLPDLNDFGLVYIPPSNPDQYFPTRLATTLTSGSSALRSVSSGVAAATAEAGENNTKGAIILETNFRIYAYTSTPLQIAILALFANLKMRFAGMVTGQLSRHSIKRAISHGITADQIIEYLASHAHEQMHRIAAIRNKPVLPPTVVDQIRLWQLETERMQVQRGYLFKDFESQAEFKAIADYADEVGVLIWRSDARQLFFASKTAEIANFIKSEKHRKKLAA